MNKILVCLAAGALVLPAFTSCNKDFLDEELTTKRNTDYFNTNEGIEALATGIYQYLRYYACSEAGYSFMNYGTDEFTTGSDNSNGMWNTYGTGLAPSVATVNSNTVGAGSLWDYMYTGINNANTLINRVETGVYTGTNTAKVAGTGYFIRGFHYYNLVTEYGGVPLKLEPTTGVSFEFERASAQEVAEQVISDLTQAYNYLPSTASKQGELTKDAAAHFLAKAYLWRASEINDSWNSSTKSDDLNQVIKYATEVINHHPLATNFADLWTYTEPDGANEQLDEIVLAAQFTSDTATWNVGGTLNFYSTSQYQNLPGMYRDIPGGREYNRLRTTYYSIYQYDLVNDSRFWKSFRTKMIVNQNTVDGLVAGVNRGVCYLVNQPGATTRYDDPTKTYDKVLYQYSSDNGLANCLPDAETGTTTGTTFVFFPDGATRYDIPMEQDLNNNNKMNFPANTKYMDGSRGSIADSHSFRDYIIARSAEDYFMIAEAYIRQGNYAQATNTLNVIRRRAAWKNGEDRGAHHDGGEAWLNNTAGQATARVAGVSSYCNRSSYYESNNIEPGSITSASDLDLTDISSLSALPAPDQEIVRHLGYSSAYDIAMCFLLNEKSREMSLELVRWVDLARTKTLVARVRAYNKEAAGNIQDYHCLRPIPQTYLDVLKRDGKSLTDAEKQAIQNPGY